MTENERMATMIACPWCEKPIEATKPHECARIDMAHLISKLRLRCEELEQKLAEQSRAFGYTRTKVMALDEENQRLRDYGDKVTAERDGLSLLRDHLEEEIGKFRTRCEKAEAQRDEARKWTRKYGRENEKLREALFLFFSEDWSHVTDADTLCEIAEEVSVKDARKWALLQIELATARNDALDEALARCKKLQAQWDRENQDTYSRGGLHAVIADIRELKTE